MTVNLPPENADQAEGGKYADVAFVVAPVVGEEMMAVRSAGIVRAALGEEELMERAVVARNNLAEEVGAKKATVTGGYNTETGQFAAAACTKGKCAEDVVVELLGGNKKKIKFTKAIRPKSKKEVPICIRCEHKYGRSAFPFDAQFQSDQLANSGAIR